MMERTGPTLERPAMLPMLQKPAGVDPIAAGSYQRTREMTLDELLLENRVIFIAGDINQASSLRVMMQMLYLEDQKRIFGEMQCIVVEEVPRIVIVFRPVSLGIRNDVRGSAPMWDATMSLHDVWLDR